MAWFYASGVVFAVLGGLIIAYEFWKLLSGQLAEDRTDRHRRIRGRRRHAAEAAALPESRPRMTIAIFLGALLGAMALGMPIAFALLACGVALMWHLDMFDAQILAQNVIDGANSFPLLAVPFFMLAGEIMNAGGLSRRIVNFAMALVGHVRGGLGYVAIMAAMHLAALSGSAVADAAALAALLLPMMNRGRLRQGALGGPDRLRGIIAPDHPALASAS